MQDFNKKDILNLLLNLSENQKERLKEEMLDYRGDFSMIFSVTLYKDENTEINISSATGGGLVEVKKKSSDKKYDPHQDRIVMKANEIIDIVTKDGED